MERFRELSPSAQTAYAQLLDAALASDVARSIENLPGSFTSKTIKEKRYWYFQFRDPIAGVRQVYVGPDSKEVQELVKRAPAGRGRNPGPLAPLAKSAVALGCAPIIPRHYRVLKQLSDCGFFRAGGVLAGTHAFLAYGNMLGVHWNDASSTQDVDFVHAGKNIALALSRDFKIKAHDAIESLKMGFIPVSGDNGRLGAGYANPTTPDFRLDFLTTLHRGGEKPYEHPSLGLTLQPLKFMELALEDVTQGRYLQRPRRRPRQPARPDPLCHSQAARLRGAKRLLHHQVPERSDAGSRADLRTSGTPVRWKSLTRPSGTSASADQAGGSDLSRDSGR